VQFLRVDGRKMTLQFFKQIPREDWLDQDLQPRTDLKVWGRVHYVINGEGVEWLLVQAGQQLKRCSFSRPGESLDETSYWQGCVDRAVERVAKLRTDLAEKAAAVEAATTPGLKALYQGNVVQWAKWLADAEAAETKARADVARHLESVRRNQLRRKRIDELAPTLEQLFIG
jgi:hypothetical protein